MSKQDLNFQQWLIDHEPDDNMIYKKAWWHEYVFWRNFIQPLFLDRPMNGEPHEHIEAINTYSKVVGGHYSKSIVHPVMRIVYKDVTIVFRYNFHDYEIAVIGNIPIKMPRELISSGNSFFYQGFPEKYVVSDQYSKKNNKTFMFSLLYQHQFYAFLTILKWQIDLYHKKHSKGA